MNENNPTDKLNKEKEILLCSGFNVEFMKTSQFTVTDEDGISKRETFDINYYNINK